MGMKRHRIEPDSQACRRASGPTGICLSSGDSVDRRSLGGAGFLGFGGTAQYMRNADGDHGAGHGSDQVFAALGISSRSQLASALPAQPD
jgi:hypothetical protein